MGAHADIPPNSSSLGLTLGEGTEGGRFGGCGVPGSLDGRPGTVSREAGRRSRKELPTSPSPSPHRGKGSGSRPDPLTSGRNSSGRARGPCARSQGVTWRGGGPPLLPTTPPSGTRLLAMGGRGGGGHPGGPGPTHTASLRGPRSHRLPPLSAVGCRQVPPPVSAALERRCFSLPPRLSTPRPPHLSE